MKTNDITGYILLVFGLGAFGFMLYVLSYRNVPEANREIFIHAFGIVEGVIVMLYAYRYGSSKGSSDKTKALIEQSSDKPEVLTTKHS